MLRGCWGGGGGLGAPFVKKVMDQLPHDTARSKTKQVALCVASFGNPKEISTPKLFCSLKCTGHLLDHGAWAEGGEGEGAQISPPPPLPPPPAPMIEGFPVSVFCLPALGTCKLRHLVRRLIACNNGTNSFRCMLT